MVLTQSFPTRHPVEPLSRKDKRNVSLLLPFFHSIPFLFFLNHASSVSSLSFSVFHVVLCPFILEWPSILGLINFLWSAQCHQLQLLSICKFGFRVFLGCIYLAIVWYFYLHLTNRPMKMLEVRKVQAVNQRVHFNYVCCSCLGMYSSFGSTTVWGLTNLSFVTEETISDLSGI